MMAFLRDNAAKSVHEVKFEQMTGRTLAIDASTNLYQFLIAIRDQSGAGLTNEAGEITSHINGFLSRTLKLLEAGAKPVYVFDGKAPDLKAHELDKRREMRADAEKELAKAQDEGDDDKVRKLVGRTVRATRKQNEDVKTLLRLMGIPVIESPCEAEAQCAELCKGKKVYAAATEDMDSLTFGATRLVRNLFVPEAKKRPIYDVDLAVAIEQLGVTMDQFIDFCILCGCDYCDKIKLVGPENAIRLIIEHGTIEKLLEATGKEAPSPDWVENLVAVRDCFKNHEVTPAADVRVEFLEPDYDGLKRFLVEEHQFNAERIDRSLARLRATREKKTQMRLDQFFMKAPTEVKAADKFDPKRKRKAKAKAGPAGKFAKK